MKALNTLALTTALSLALMAPAAMAADLTPVESVKVESDVTAIANERAASYWGKLADEKDAVLGPYACHEQSVEIACGQSCVNADKLTNSKQVVGKEVDLKAPGHEVIDKTHRNLQVATASARDVSTFEPAAPSSLHTTFFITRFRHHTRHRRRGISRRG